MAHRHNDADEGFASSSSSVAAADSSSTSVAAATSASITTTTTASSSHNNSSSSDDVILVTADDDEVVPELYLPSAAAVSVAASSSSSTSSSNNANKDAPREASDPSIVACSSSTASASAESSAAAVLDCPICLQTCIHPARLPCGHIFCFLCVKGVAYKNRRCAMCRREIPPEFLDHPQLVNGIDDICTTKATDDGYQWFYEGRNGWWQYDDRTSQDIEDAYRKGEKTCTILVAGYVYLVDLEAMLQQRQNEPTRCRHVKRDLATIPKKGVAGLRIEGNTVTTDSNFAATQLWGGGGAGANGDDDEHGDHDYSLRRRLLPTATSASDFISTIAATDAAIRIASDIIDSTLAFADELSRGAAVSSLVPTTTTLTSVVSSSSSLAANTSGEQFLIPAPLSSTSTSNSAATGRGSLELLGAAQDQLVLIEQTLNDFHALTLRGISSSDEEAEEDAEEAGGNNPSNTSAAAGGNEHGHSHRNRQMRF